jgi:hypothetical protein
VDQFTEPNAQNSGHGCLKFSAALSGPQQGGDLPKRILPPRALCLDRGVRFSANALNLYSGQLLDLTNQPTFERSNSGFEAGDLGCVFAAHLAQLHP